MLGKMQQFAIDASGILAKTITNATERGIINRLMNGFVGNMTSGNSLRFSRFRGTLQHECLKI